MYNVHVIYQYVYHYSLFSLPPSIPPCTSTPPPTLFCFSSSLSSSHSSLSTLHSFLSSFLTGSSPKYWHRQWLP